MGSGIKEFHNFVLHDFAKKIRYSYEQFNILSEADLQAIAWKLIGDFIEKHDTNRKLKVFNKPFFKGLGIHPDLALFRKQKPWVLIELKERRRLSKGSAQKEWKRLIKARKSVRPKLKRGYLVYVARTGDGRILKGPKKKGARFFFEVPIVLGEMWPQERVAAWQREFDLRRKV